MNPPSSTDIHWEPTKHVGLKTFYDGSKRWYHCSLCNYFNDRLYHSKMHYERIHVKKGRSIPRKQKYADLSILQAKNPSDITTGIEAGPEGQNDAQPSDGSGNLQPDKSDIYDSCEFNASDGFKDSVDAIDYQIPQVEIEQMVTSDPNVGDSIRENLSKTETADSSILNFTTSAAELESLRNLDSTRAMIFTFGDGSSSTTPNSTVGSYVSFDTKSATYRYGLTLSSGRLHRSPGQVVQAIEETSPSSDESIAAELPEYFEREMLDQTYAINSNKSSPNIRYRQMSHTSGNSGFSTPHSSYAQRPVPTIKPEVEAPSQYHSTALNSTRLSHPRGSCHLSDTDICYSPMYAEFPMARTVTSVEEKSHATKDFSKDLPNQFSTPKSRRMLLDASPNPMVLSCQQTGARVHDYLSGRESTTTLHQNFGNGM
jgi:hypothetical protein